MLLSSRFPRFAAILLALAAAVAGAQVPTAGLPGGDYQIVVPVAPGGGIDAIARLVAHHWTTQAQLPVTVINRAGASGNIGTASVARAQPDGRTLLVTAASHLTSPMLHENAGYDAIQDFTGIARFATAPNVLLVSDALKGMTLQQLLQDPRSRNKGFSFGSAGYGHSSHLAPELFMARTGANWLHVPYKGNGPALRALIAGEIHILFLSVPSVPAALATGKVHALGVANHERLAILPQLPTLTELGVHNADFVQWYGLLAPRGTPAETVKALSALATQTLRDPGVVAQLQAHGSEPGPLDHAQFQQFLVAEQRRLQALLSKEPVERPVN
jgi:tripartite-type tricarboxylate transporter receptor subunit TctC